MTRFIGKDGEFLRIGDNVSVNKRKGIFQRTKRENSTTLAVIKFKDGHTFTHEFELIKKEKSLKQRIKRRN